MQNQEPENSFGHLIPDTAVIEQQVALGFAVRSNTAGPELIIDNFAGGGGVSEGLEAAFGRAVDIAINHNGEALAMHIANHPSTAHYQEDVFGVHPGFITGNRPIGLAWFSPDCTHHSKAKGGKPREQKIRGLAWIALKWGALRKPRCMAIENVEELTSWGPLDEHGKPIKSEAGRTFQAFLAALSVGLSPDHPDVPEIYSTLGADFPMERLYAGLGYAVEYRVLRASDFGVPTRRKRLFIFCRCDGLPIRWPSPSHGNPAARGFKDSGLQPWRTAADCIDFDLHAESLFGRKKPLADNTQRRIAKGLVRHVFASPRPFIVTKPGAEPIQDALHAGDAIAPFVNEHANSSNQRTMRADEPMRTICAQVKGGHFSIVAPLMGPLRGTSEAHLGAHSVEQPLSTVSAGGSHHALVGAHLITVGYGEREGQDARAQSIEQPLGSVVTANKHALVEAYLVDMGHGEQCASGATRWSHGTRSLQTPLNTVTASGATSALAAVHLTHLTHQGERSGHAVDEPVPTVTSAHRGEQAVVTAFLEQANGGFYDGPGNSCDAPTSTIVGRGTQQRLVTAYLVKYYSNGGQWQALDEPMHTLPTKARMGLVEAVKIPIDSLAPKHRESARQCAGLLHRHLPDQFPDAVDVVLMPYKGSYWALVDITLRMLTPRELARAQGFPDDYILDPLVRRPASRGEGASQASRAMTREKRKQGTKATDRKWVLAPLSKTAQIRMIGNSVPPPLVAALIRANFGHEQASQRMAA